MTREATSPPAVETITVQTVERLVAIAEVPRAQPESHPGRARQLRERLDAARAPHRAPARGHGAVILTSDERSEIEAILLAPLVLRGVVERASSPCPSDLAYAKEPRTPLLLEVERAGAAWASVRANVKELARELREVVRFRRRS